MINKPKLEVYDLAYNRLCVLTDNTSYTARDIVEEYKINGVSKLSFTLPLMSDKWKYLLNENLVKWKGEYYFIKTPSYSHSESERLVSVTCLHLCTSLEGKTCKEITEIEGIGKTANELMTMVLDGTNWSVGVVEVPDTKKRDLITKEQSVFTNLIKISEKFEGRLDFDSVGKRVSLLTTPINRGVQLRKNKNLQSLNIDYDTSDMVTRLYPFGGEDPVSGVIINIMDVNPTGKSYIENYNYYLQQGYTQAYIDAHPELFLKEMTWNANDYKTEQDLYDDAVKKINDLAKPKVKCTVEGLNLSVFPDYFIKEPIIGEDIIIYDDDLSLKLKAQVVDLKIDSKKPLGMKIEISNEVMYNSVVSQIVDSSKTVNKVVDPLNLITGQYIKEATIDTAHIKDASITNAKIGNAEIDTAKIKDASITNAKIANASIDTANIKDLSVTKAKIADASIDTAKIIDASIDTAKIKDASITNAKIDRASIDKLQVVTADIADASITNAKIDRASINKLVVDTGDIKDASITNAKIGNAQIDTAKIKDASITNAKIDRASVDRLVVGTADIALGAIDSALIKDGAVGKMQIADASITDAKIVSVSAGSIKSGTLDASLITVTNLKADSITAGALTIDANNMIHNTAWLADTSTWILNTGWSRDTSLMYDTSYTLKVSQTGNVSDVYSASYSEFIPTSSGQTFVASVYSYATDITTIDNGAYLQIEWYNDTTRIAWISQSIKPTVNSTWQRFNLSSTSPAGTTKARIKFFPNRNGTFWVARPMLQRGSIASEWKLHTDEQISNGAINNDKIADNTITGGKIVADAITAREIASKTITANEILANTITANEIKANTITSNEIKSGSILVGSLDNGVQTNINNGALAYTMNQVGVIDNLNDTLFHFDDDLCATNGLNPNSGYVVTQRKSEGKFSSAIAVEESTTNTLANIVHPIFLNAYNGTNNVFGSTTNMQQTKVTMDTPIGNVDCTKVSRINSGVNQSDYVQTSIQTSYNANEYLTYSFYYYGTYGTQLKIYLNSATTGLYLYSNTSLISGNGTTMLTFNVPKYQWIRLVITVKNTTASTATFGSMWMVLHNDIVATTLNNTEYWLFTGFQSEAKLLPTSYVKDTRSNGKLIYPADCINPTQGTIGFWYQPQYDPLTITSQAVSPMMIQIGTYYDNSSVSIWNYSNTFTLHVKGLSNSGWTLTKQVAWNSADFQQYKWIYITITWNSTSWSMYVNGIKVGTGTSTEILGTPSNNTISIGGTNGNGNFANGLFDEVYISKKCLSDTQIQAIYTLQQPLIDTNPKINPPSPSTVTITLI
jgi:phage minor structural protein